MTAMMTANATLFIRASDPLVIPHPETSCHTGVWPTRDAVRLEQVTTRRPGKFWKRGFNLATTAEKTTVPNRTA